MTFRLGFIMTFRVTVRVTFAVTNGTSIGGIRTERERETGVR